MKQNNSTTYPQKISRLNFFSRLEAAELPKLLMPDEQVLGVISGFYTAGTAILCVTSKRLLLVDKKWMRLSFEDVRFESIKEISYSHQAFTASVKFFYAGREMQFRSWYKQEMRTLAQFVQNKMFEARAAQHHANERIAQQNDSALDPYFAPSQTIATQPLFIEKEKKTGYSYDNPQIEKYLSERIARWRKASKFIDNLPTTAKASKT